jgi:hypothetical protein
MRSGSGGPGDPVEISDDSSDYSDSESRSRSNSDSAAGLGSSISVHGSNSTESEEYVPPTMNTSGFFVDSGGTRGRGGRGRGRWGPPRSPDETESDSDVESSWTDRAAGSNLSQSGSGDSVWNRAADDLAQAARERAARERAAVPYPSQSGSGWAQAVRDEEQAARDEMQRAERDRERARRRERDRLERERVRLEKEAAKARLTRERREAREKRRAEVDREDELASKDRPEKLDTDSSDSSGEYNDPRSATTATATATATTDTTARGEPLSREAKENVDKFIRRALGNRYRNLAPAIPDGTKRRRTQHVPFDPSPVLPPTAAYVSTATHLQGGDRNLGEVCGICTSRMTMDQSISRTACSHFFHAECLDAWRDHVRRFRQVPFTYQCPICKHVLS